MSMSWFDWEIQEEGGSRTTRYRPAPSAEPFGTRMKLGPTGHAEIKPHTWLGVKKGQIQLDGSTVTGPKVLITYRPLNAAGGIATTGRPACLAMYMTCHTPEAKPDAVLKGKWWYLGSPVPPEQVPLTVDNPGLFGSGIEDFVRRHFDKEVLQPRKRKLRPGTGSGRTGPDVLWDELAGMYGELGRQLGDPFYAELAAALAGPRR